MASLINFVLTMCDSHSLDAILPTCLTEAVLDYILFIRIKSYYKTQHNQVKLIDNLGNKMLLFSLSKFTSS